MSQLNIGVIVGSARRDAFSKKAAEELVSYLPESYQVKFLKIEQLELFNQDYDDDGTTPESWKTFREEVKGMDAYIFVTPEYNRSIPPVLKNALDIASRPYGQNCWSGKPGAVVSVSPGATGAFGANHHLRQVLTFLNIYTMQQPEVYLSNVGDLLDDNGNFIEGTKGFIKSAAEAYTDWVSKFKR